MKVKYIKVENFKSFSDEHIEFENFTVILGANASGKSNVISLFRFISNIISSGIDDAISLMGGIEYSVNTSIGKEKPIKIEFLLDVPEKKYVRVLKKEQGLQIKEMLYSFEILPNKRGSGYRIIKDYCKLNYDVVQVDRIKRELEIVDELSVEFSLDKNKVSSKISSNEGNEKTIQKEFGLGILSRIINEDKGELILNKIDFFMPPSFKSIKIYDFDPKLIKKTCSFTSIKSLEEDGSNLANVLQGILKTQKGRKKLSYILSECLPFIQEISAVNYNFDKSISFKIKEKYNNKPFYSNFLSDGTVNILALIVSLYFEESSGIAIIEEPERNLHPRLMSKIVEMAKDTSQKKQVIITTHNPEFIKYTDINSILFTQRCEKGFTKISKPVDSEKVIIFLKNELGIEDLFVQDLLGE